MHRAFLPRITIFMATLLLCLPAQAAESESYARLRKLGLLDASPPAQASQDAPVGVQPGAQDSAPLNVAPAEAVVAEPVVAEATAAAASTQAVTASAGSTTPVARLRSGMSNLLDRLGLRRQAAPGLPVAAPQAPAAMSAEAAPVSPEVSTANTVAAADTPVAETSTPASLAASAAEKPGPLASAYAMLRAKGLLPGGEQVHKSPSLRTPRHSGAERVLVDKSERKLYLFRNGHAYREYRISLGGMPVGPKQKAGDLRTPEGFYTVDWRNPRSRYYKSLHISYPNEQDRVRAARLGVDPGGDIMIHGEHYLPSLQRTLRRAKTPKDWTEGCIAMNNEFIDEIWKEVADGTPIEIRP